MPWKKRLLLLAFALVFALAFVSAPVQAQGQGPCVSYANALHQAVPFPLALYAQIDAVYNGNNNAQQCNPNLYAGGGWPQNDNLQTLAVLIQHSHDCSDPWIGEVYAVYFHTTASGALCMASNYGGGQWSSFSDLVNKVTAYRNAQSARVTQPAQGTIITPGQGSGNLTPLTPAQPGSVAPGPCVSYARALPSVPFPITLYAQIDAVYVGNNNAKQCNPNLYAGGNWPQNDNLRTLAALISHSHDCSDPWIGEVYGVYFGATASGVQCVASNYGGGQWSSFPDLVNKVTAYRNAQSARVTQPARPAQPSQGSSTPPGQPPAILTPILPARPGSMALGGSGGNVVAGGGANVVAGGGANVVAGGGANVVAGGGANIGAGRGASLVNSGGNRVVAGGGANVVAGGGANVVAGGGANVVAGGGANVVAGGGANLRGYSTQSVVGVRAPAGKYLVAPNGTLVDATGRVVRPANSFSIAVKNGAYTLVSAGGTVHPNPGMVVNPN